MKSKALANYQHILRAIGQGLEALEVKAFDLKVSDNHYLVRGESKKPRTSDAPKAIQKKSFLSLILHGKKKGTVDASGLRPFRFTGLRFTPKDIELLERKGQVLQTNFESSAPNSQSLSQILRTVGGYLDLHRCRLSKLSWRDNLLTLWYINRQGVEAKDILSSRALNDQWVQQSKHRKPKPALKRTGND